jgi:hypothetical protein
MVEAYSDDRVDLASSSVYIVSCKNDIYVDFFYLSPLIDRPFASDLIITLSSPCSDHQWLKYYYSLSLSL